MSESLLREKLIHIIERAKETSGYCKQAMIHSHKNVCVYGLGKFFEDVFEERDFKNRFGVNYLSDRDENKWGKTICQIETVPPESLKSVPDLVVIILLGGDTIVPEEQFLRWGIPFVTGTELLLEMSLDEPVSREMFEANTILDVFDSLGSEQSKEIYTELLANRLVPELREKHYPDLYSHSPDYFDRECLSFTGREAFVDCGGYTGDTIGSFLKEMEAFQAIYSLELDEDNYQELCRYVDTLPNEVRQKITCYRLGVWDEKTMVSYGNETDSPQEASSILKTSNEKTVEADRLDHILEGKLVTFIKMDIEGAELRALKGARRILEEQKPKLAICLYHKVQDFWEIPSYLRKIVPEYRFEVRHHFWLSLYGTVLYAQCPEN